MTKRDIAIRASKKSGIIQEDVLTCIDLFCECVMEAMNEGETITIRNFGTFYVQEKPERKRRNPQNGKPIIVSAEKVVKFRSTQPLKS